MSVFPKSLCLWSKMFSLIITSCIYIMAKKATWQSIYTHLHVHETSCHWIWCRWSYHSIVHINILFIFFNFFHFILDVERVGHLKRSRLAQPSRPSLGPMAMVFIEDLMCTVCLDIPRNRHIFQCTEGHLICTDCNEGWQRSQRDYMCPTCRESFQANPPKRIKAIERIIQNLSD